MGVLLDTAPDYDLGAKVESCVATLLAMDGFLLSSGANEQTITGRLAHYLQDSFPEHHVDPEYNRHGVRVKTAQLFVGSKVVKPDVVIHWRNDDDHNLLVIEAKVHGRGSDEDRAHAHDKLSALVHGDEFRYRYGLFIELGQDELGVGCVAEFQWYARQIS